MDKRRLLSLDWSKANTGICVGCWGERPTLTSISFGKDDDLTRAAASVIAWFPDALKVFKPEIVVLEAAFSTGGGIATRLAFGADFFIKGCCSLAGIRMDEVHNSTWKRDIFGSANLKSEDAKKKSVQIAKEFGMEPKSHDEADAFCIWLWTFLYPLKGRDEEAEQRLARLKWKLL